MPKETKEAKNKSNSKNLKSIVEVAKELVKKVEETSKKATTTRKNSKSEKNTESKVDSNSTKPKKIVASKKSDETKKDNIELKKDKAKKSNAELKKEKTKKGDAEIKKEKSKKGDAEIKKEKSKKGDAEIKKEKSKKGDAEVKKEKSKKIDAEIKKEKPKKIDTKVKKEKTKKSDIKVKKERTKKVSKMKSTQNAVIEKETSNSKEILDFTPEYYDLPYRYNQTIVKILAQTPTHIFVYWDISDSDRENLKKQYGEYFFEITKPVLIVHNKSLNYSFEVDINDFANSWYLNVNDSSCEYAIELGRRPIPINYNYIPNYNLDDNGPIHPVEIPYIYISSSNELEVPNDHILYQKTNKIYFKNIKNNQIIEKDIKNLKYAIGKDNKFKDIYQLYLDLYKEEISRNSIDLNNPSSGNLSSGSFSQKYK